MLRGVSMRLSRGRVTALIGANGSGKTTLLRVVLGLIRPRSGRISHPAGAAPRIGYVPQVDVSEVRFPVTAREVVLMGLTPTRPLLGLATAAQRRACLDALRRMDVEDLAERQFRDLSGGQRQRVLLARGLVADPELLALDEPVRGLDFASSAALVEQITGFARQHHMAVIVATHSLDLVANHADDVVLMAEGRAEAGPADEIMTTERLTAFHGRPVRVERVGDQRVVLP